MCVSIYIGDAQGEINTIVIYTTTCMMQTNAREIGVGKIN